MSKKSGFIIFLLVILAGGVVFFGMSYSKKQREQLMTVAEQTDQKVEEVTKEDVTAQIAGYEENRGELSIIDYLKYVSLLKDEVSISFYGDIAQEEQWVSEIDTYIKDQIGSTMKVNRLPYTDYNTYQLISENKVTDLAQTNPDVVFFQLTPYADQELDIALADSSDYLEMNYAAIKDVLPEALIVFVSPNPSSSEKGDTNSRTLDYTSYLNEMISTVESNEWIGFNLHDSYLEKLEADGISLESTLTENGKSMNSEGTAVYSTLFEEALNQKRDTTSGI
ncbi:hypothetical protein LHA31_11990 [Carnobacterium viridans]|uniref:SGNH/GDSL hydrolase family protein n=1 Tax=Carnobacterium viridans TaxID=174587 RepID=A0A1H0YB28_9LACT|nr:hypothetical protein [Carnobacterium viridans]UDE95236.1 hypothetical protein LHA31_11990 [Carnobacterium viridans]SDQ12404.1 hypothetical protein SAMN04487752_0840 [Carnobacterium viridans]